VKHDGVGDGVAILDREGRTIPVADAHRSDEERLVVHAGAKLTAFLELEAAVRTSGKSY
jgi:hypothetical protein